MAYQRACTIVRKGQCLVEAQRKAAVLKLMKYTCKNFFRVCKVMVMETDLSQAVNMNPDICTPNITNLELRIICNEDELESLVKDGYDFSFYTDIKVDRNRFRAGAHLITVFINKELAFKDWIALTRESAVKLGPFLKYIPYNGQAVGAAAETNPRYRCLGLFHYATANKIRHAMEMGKTRLLAYVESDNLASCKVQGKIGSVIAYTGFRIRLFYLWDVFYLRHPAFFAEKKDRIATQVGLKS